MSDRNKGYLITFEGPDGSGKSAAITRISEWMKETHGIVPICSREPGGTWVGDQIRIILSDFSNHGMTSLSELLLFQASRAEITEKEIIPALENGSVVILDRFKDSSVVYQGIARGLGVDFVNTINDKTTQEIDPNLTILVHVPFEVGLLRKSMQGELDRLDGESHTFHKSVEQAYLELYQTDTSGRWELVDGTQPLDEVVSDIEGIIETRLIKAGFIERPNIGVERMG